MKLKQRIVLFRNCIKRMVSDIKQLSLGQKESYDLLQLSHRLEKGLLIKKPKPLWGWDKAYRISELLKNNKDEFSSSTAEAVLSAFLENKSKSCYQEDRNRCALFIQETQFHPQKNEKAGGAVEFTKPVFSSDELIAIEKLFFTRHSCRNFSKNIISKEVLNHAVEMALRCPSACNRQPFKVYAIEPSLLEDELGEKLQYYADKSLIITGDIRAFTTSEMLDWLISPTIFAGYLSLSLHALGIGSCVVRKELVKSTSYNNAVRKITGMSNSECVVLEMFIGYYPEEFIVPVSNRASINQIIKYV